MRKVERYFIGRAPVLFQLLRWAENCEDVIDNDLLFKACGARLTTEQALNVNASVWGFLSSTISGPAEAIFKRAETLRGLDVWRRITGFINHGKNIRLNALRTQVMTIRTRPIPSLEKIEEGVADFENLLAEYELAGGTLENDQAMKSDLFAILPAEVRKSSCLERLRRRPFRKVPRDGRRAEPGDLRE